MVNCHQICITLEFKQVLRYKLQWLSGYWVGLEWLSRLLMGMLSRGCTGLGHVCYLTTKARPEHTIATMAESKLPVGGMKFAQEVCLR